MGKLRKIFLILGISLCLYPMISSLFAKQMQGDIWEEYQNIVEHTDSTEIQKQITLAQTYNQALYHHTSGDYQEYQSILCITKEGMIGQLEIPKIDLQLPIYHGTQEHILGSGVGHMYGSSFPVAGNNVHCALAAHSGIPSSDLFRYLERLSVGDYFWIYLYREKSAYRVCQIQVVEETETEVLRIQSGKNLVSLITCTPYGINTHRLIVTGERMEENIGK